MNLKKKVEDLKNKAKENWPDIALTVSAVASVVTASYIAYLSVENAKLNKKYRDHLETVELAFLGKCDKERIYISEETEKEILEGSQDVWFDVNGKDFRLTYRPEEE